MWRFLLLSAMVFSGTAAALAGEAPRAPYVDLDFLFASSATLPGEIRGVEARCTCGQIVALREGVEYESPGSIQSFAFLPRERRLFFVRPGGSEIFCVYFSVAGPLPEWVVYRHDGTIVDLAVREEEEGWALYFSSADPASGQGAIYRLSPDGEAEEAVRISFDPMAVWWDGFFSFDPRGRLYLASGERLPGRIYRWEEGGLEEVARIPARRIGGFAFLDPWTVLASDLDGHVWKLDLRGGEPIPVYSSRGRFRISDVALYPAWWEDVRR